MKLSGSDIHLLRIFDAVARNGGFSAAQTELNLSQPTISNHITALEERLGVQLCQRGRRGFLLTEKGRIVHETAQSLLRSLDDYSTQLTNLKGALVGKLRVGTVDSTVTDPQMKLPQTFAAFSSRANEVELELSQDNPQELQRKVLEGIVHVGIGSFENRIYGLDYKDLYVEHHYLYCGSGHPLFDQSDADLSLEEVGKYPLVRRGYWSRRLQRLMNAADSGHTSYEIEPQLMLILSDRFLGLLPAHYAASYVRDGRLRQVLPDETEYTCAFQAITKSGRKPRVISAFLEDIGTAFGV
jgi:DNA-binding transcriptional LysR family regulator